MLDDNIADFNVIGKRLPNKNEHKITVISFAGKLKKTFRKFVNVALQE